MYYYLICKERKFYTISGAITDFGPDIAKKEIVDFIEKAMIDNWKIELIDENKMQKLDKNQEWVEYKSWMKI